MVEGSRDKVDNSPNEVTEEVKVPAITEQTNSGESKGYDLRPRNRQEDNSRSTGGLAHSHIPKASVRRKSFLNKAQLQAAREIMEGKQAIIGRALRVKKYPNRGP